jgi:hypothetical protein
LMKETRFSRPVSLEISEVWVFIITRWNRKSWTIT